MVEAWETQGGVSVCKLIGRNMREHRGGPERHDAKADPAWTGGRLARSEHILSGRRVRTAAPGWWMTACQQGTTGNTGSPSVRSIGWAGEGGRIPSASLRPTGDGLYWPNLAFSTRKTVCPEESFCRFPLAS